MVFLLTSPELGEVRRTRIGQLRVNAGLMCRGDRARYRALDTRTMNHPKTFMLVDRGTRQVVAAVPITMFWMPVHPISIGLSCQIVAFAMAVANRRRTAIVKKGAAVECSR